MSVAFQDALSGAVGSVVSVLCTYPLDVAKTRLQAQNRNVDSSGAPPSSNSKSPSERCSLTSADFEEARHVDPQITRQVSGPIPYSGTVDCLTRIVREEGVSQLCVGLRPKCVYTAMTNFVFFYLLRALRPYLGHLPLWQGIGAGVGVQLTVLPIDMVVVRLQSLRGSSATFIDVLRDILATGGIFGLWSGLLPGLSLTLNPGINQRVLAWLLQSKRPSSATIAFWSGAFAKAVASIITYPLMRAKVKMQTQSMVSDCKVQQNAMQVMAQMLADEGIVALFDGLTPQLVNAVLKEAILQMMSAKISILIARTIRILRGSAQSQR